MSDHKLDAFNAVLDAHPTAWQYCGTDGTGVIADAVRAAVDAARAPLLAEVERLKANQQPDDGEWTWQYGFYLDGDFVHHGDEGQTRRIARFAKKPIMRRQVRYGRVEPIPSQSDSAASDTPPESTTDQTAPQTP